MNFNEEQKLVINWNLCLEGFLEMILYKYLLYLKSSYIFIKAEVHFTNDVFTFTPMTYHVSKGTDLLFFFFFGFNMPASFTQQMVLDCEYVSI